MPVCADTLRDHIEYTAWATGRLLDAAARLSPEELTRDFATSERSVVGTLAHTFGAERVWLARVTGAGKQSFLADSERDLGFLSREWPALYEGWRAWARGLTDENVLVSLDYRDLKGNPWSTPTWQIVLHVVNHGAHHRGQVSGFLRALGQTPPALDLIVYYRQKGR